MRGGRPEPLTTGVLPTAGGPENGGPFWRVPDRFVRTHSATGSRNQNVIVLRGRTGGSCGVRPEVLVGQKSRLPRRCFPLWRSSRVEIGNFLICTPVIPTAAIRGCGLLMCGLTRRPEPVSNAQAPDLPALGPDRGEIHG
jgi:hypothetical protein